MILQIQMPRTGNKHAEKSSKALLWKWVSAGPHSVAMPHTDSPGENKNKTFPPTSASLGLTVQIKPRHL